MKSYFDRNRAEFDNQQPPDLWKAIEGKLPKAETTEKMVPLKRVWQVAAGVALIIGAAWILSLPNTHTEMAAKTEAEATGPPQVALEYPELEEAGIYYQTKIDAAGEELKAYALDEKDFESIRLLEDELDALRESLGNEPDDEKVVEAMIQIYRFKLDLMKDLLNQLKNESDVEEGISVVPM